MDGIAASTGKTVVHPVRGEIHDRRNRHGQCAVRVDRAHLQDLEIALVRAIELFAERGVKGICAIAKQRFARMPDGASLVLVGRGGYPIDGDLRAALDSGRIATAIVDVTLPEPLPANHWMWSHPRIWLTPHVASMTQPESAVAVVLNNLRRFENGEPMIGQVDRERGY